MSKFYIITVALFVTSVNCEAIFLDSIPLINSNEVIEQAEKLHDEGTYDEAIKLFLTISESDTNFVKMRTKLLLSYIGSEKYKEALELSEQGIKTKSPYRVHFYWGLANTYEKLGKSDTAVHIYQQGLDEYPYHNFLYYSMGTALLQQEKIPESIAALQQAIRINPFHSASHLMLGSIMISMGEKTKATLSIATYLALNPSNNKALVLLNDLLREALTYEGTVTSVFDKKVFHEVDLLIKSKAALDPKFKTAIKLQAPVAQQLELMMAHLKMDQESDDFWMRNYVPFFTNVYKEGLREAFIHHIITSANNKDVDKWIKSHKNELSMLYDLANESFSKIREYQHLEIDGQAGRYKFWFYNNNRLNAIGNQNSEDINIGPWLFFHANGEKMASGSYNEEGEKIGNWEYYNEEGTLEKTEPYDENGILNGVVNFYSPNGKILNKIEYKNDTLNGIVKIYYDCGAIKEVMPYANGHIYGKGLVYALNGAVRTEYNYSYDTLDGVYTFFYSNGQAKEIYNYKKGKLEGDYTFFSSNGKVLQRGTYVNNEIDGKWIGYHENGRKEVEGSFSNGKKIGDWKYFHDNGNIKEEISFTDGVRNGTVKYYDKDGIIHNEFNYSDGLVTGYRYFDKGGKIISEVSDKKGNFAIRSYYPDGKQSGEGFYKKGKLNGLFTYYYHNGIKRSMVNYKDNIYDGPYKEFYEATGQLQAQFNYEKGAENGYYRYFYQNGQLKTEGWIIDDNMEQTWINYYPDGSIKNRQYYINGKVQGEYEDYDPEGRIYLSSIHDKKYTLHTYQYDTLGEIRHMQNNDYGTGAYVLKNYKKKDRFTTSLSCNAYTSDLKTYYTNGQLKTSTPVLNGDFEGEYRSFYESGKPHAVGNYRDDKQDGKWTWYYESGAIESVNYYKNGLLDSLSIDYYENGQIESTCQYTEGEKYGTCKSYDVYGDLQIEKYYNEYGFTSYSYQDENGQLLPPITNHNNEITAYYSNGKVSVKQRYKNGYLDGADEIYYATGQLSKKRYLEAGVSVNSSEEYHPNGKLKKVVPYKYGVLHGTVKEYHDNGKLKRTTIYKLDNRHGKERIYDENGKIVSETVYINDYIY